MKNRNNGFGRSSVAVAVLLCMLLSIFAPTVMAAEAAISEFTGTMEETNNKGNSLNYVSIGDSMANGYGFVGYEQNSDDLNVYDPMAKDDKNGNVGEDYGLNMYGAGAYPLQFEKYLEDKGVTVNHTKLATSAMLPVDFYYLLGGLKEEHDDKYSGYLSYISSLNVDDVTVDGEVKKGFATFVQEAVTNADVITLGLGNASFGAFLMDKMTRAIGVLGWEFDKDNEILTLEYALDGIGLDDEEIADIVNYVHKYMDVLDVKGTLAKYGFDDETKIANAINIAEYTVASFIVYYKLCVEQILKMNPDVKIIFVGLLNTTYGTELAVDENPENNVALGDMMEEMFGMLNDYVKMIPALVKAEKNAPAASFYFAEQPQPRFICQVIEELYNNNWSLKDDGRLSGAIVRDRNIKSYNGDLRGMIGDAFHIDLPEIGLADVEAFEKDTPSWAYKDYGYGFTGNGDDYKILSVAIYLGLEKAIVECADINTITLNGAKALTNKNELLGVFTGLDLPLNPEAEGVDFNEYLSTTPEVVAAKLYAHLTSTDDIKGLCKVYAMFKVGDGMSVHPTPAGHDEIVASVIEAYEGEAIGVDTTLAAVRDVYFYLYNNDYITFTEALDIASFASANDIVDTIAYAYNAIIEKQEDDSVKKDIIANIIAIFAKAKVDDVKAITEVFFYLYNNEYITIAEALDIVSFAKVNTVIDTVNYLYNTLIKNDEITDDDRMAIIVNVYSILKGNVLGNASPAMDVAMNIYNKLIEKKFITNKEAFKIVDFVYDRVIDGVVDSKDITAIILYVYKVVFQNDNINVAFANEAVNFALAADGDALEEFRQLTAADKIETIDVIFGELEEAGYVDQAPVLKPVVNLYENMKANENISEGDLITLIDIVVENTATAAENGVVITELDEEAATEFAMNIVVEAAFSGRISPDAVNAIVQEVASTITQINPGAGAVVPVLPDISGALKIFNLLKEDGLVTEAQATLIINKLYSVLMSDELNSASIADVINYVYNEVFADDSLDVSSKILILGVIYIGVKDEVQGAIDFAQIYYNEAFAYAYDLADDFGYVAKVTKTLRGAVKEINKAIAAIEALGDDAISETLKAAVIAELDNAIVSVQKAHDFITDAESMTLDEFVSFVASYEAEAYGYLAAAQNLLAIAGSDALDAALAIWDTQVVPEIDILVGYVMENADDYLVEAFKVYAPVIGQAAWEALLATPDAIKAFIDFIVEYAPYVEEFFNEYGVDKFIKYFGEIAVDMGVDALAAVIAQGETGLAILAALVEEYGISVKEFVLRYAEVLGFAVETEDAINQVLTTIYGEIDRLEGILDCLEGDLDVLKDKLNGVVGAVQDELNAQIAALELKIEDIKAIIADLKAEAEAVYAEGAAIVDAAKLVADAVMDLADAINSGDKDAIIAAVTNLSTAIENLRTAGESAEKIIKHITILGEKLVIAAKYTADALIFIADRLVIIAEKLEEVSEELDGVAGDLDGAAADLDGLAGKLVGIAADIVKFAADIAGETSETIKNAMDLADRVGNDINNVINIAKDLYDKALNGDYEFDEDNSYYVAIGDNFGDKSYVDFLADKIGFIKENYKNLTGENLGFTLEEALAVINANKNTIAKADLITLNYSKLVAYDIKNLLGDKNWEEVLGAEAAAKIDEIVAQITEALEAPLAELLAGAPQIPFGVEDILGMIEGYIYVHVARLVSLHQIIDALAEVSPEATIVIIGAYNELSGVTLEVGDMSVELGGYFDIITDIINLNSFACAFFNNNTIFVSVSDAQTNVQANGGKLSFNSFEDMAQALRLMDNFIPSAEGNRYIADKIFAALNVEVHDHVYSYKCDPSCDICGKIRDVSSLHTYDNACDVDCNVCGATRTVGDHVRSAICDNTCDICGAIIDAAPHNFGAWTTDRQPTYNVMGIKSRVCSNEGCGLVETAMIDVLLAEEADEGVSVGLVIGIVIPSAFVLAAGGFSGYWFVYKKRTFKDLTNAISKLLASLKKH